jgi:16S rRNA (guanine527-N7)-methyltransferase
MRLLTEGSEALGISLDDRQIDQFQTYYAELAEWNQRINLTSVVDYEEVQVKHFLDSLTVCIATGRPLPSGSRLIDVGAGAGLPGIPLKIVFPDLRVSLLESTGKKTEFLRFITDILALEEVEIHTGRAEQLAHQTGLRESFDLAVSRGVARLPTLAEYTLPFCGIGGKLVALKHGGIEGEIESASHALTILGGRFKSIHPVDLPGLEDNRVALEIEKIGPTPEQYPRRAGIPAKRPL